MEGNGNTSCFSLKASSRLAFRERYVQKFVPLLSCIREKIAMKRYQAVKRAADFSLACTAGRTSWSKALRRRLSVDGRAKQRKMQNQKSSCSYEADEAGLAFLERLRRRRIRARAQSLNYRKSFLQAQKQQRKSKLVQDLVTHNGQLEDTQVTNRPRMIAQYGNKFSSLSELIPGGLHMDIPKLLDQTAHYIISLQLQVDALSFLGQQTLSP